MVWRIALLTGGNPHDGGGGLVAKSCPTLATPWTVAHQALLPMGFSRQEYWSGMPFPSPRDLPTQGSNQSLLYFRQSPALQVNSLLLSHQGAGEKEWRCVHVWLS